jgi:hypothetical protein
VRIQVFIPDGQVVVNDKGKPITSNATGEGSTFISMDEAMYSLIALGTNMLKIIYSHE